MRRRQSKRDGEDNQECVKSIDRSSPVVFERLFSRRLEYLLHYSLRRRRCCSFRPRRDKTRVIVVEDTCTLIDARSRLGDLFFSTHTNISPLSLSLSLEQQHSMLHRRRVRRGPTMAMIALKCPHIEVNRESVSHQSRFCAFHHDIVHLYYSSPKCAGPKCPRVRHTTGPRRRRHFFDDARDAIAEEKRSRRTVGRVVGGLLSPFFVGSGVLTLSSLFRANVTLIFALFSHSLFHVARCRERSSST